MVTASMIKKPRVMWLVNDTTARSFEITMLNQVGVKEIFLPKKFPNDPSFINTVVDYSEDKHLTIPAADLQVLNNIDWYETPYQMAWDIANRHFDILFFSLYNPNAIQNILKNFKGTIILRGYGLLTEAISYSAALAALTNHKGPALLQQLGTRFWFAHAYPYLNDNEVGVIRERAIYLPLGLLNNLIATDWHGQIKKIFFICPEIKLQPYSQSVYQHFLKNFHDFPYVIGGAQSLPIKDKHILGYLPKEELKTNMRMQRVMLYHSIDPNHIHFYPFEAIGAGMPLVFMAAGMLDRFGGENLPGRCKTIKEARKKIRRILNDDWHFINEIRNSQDILLKQMTEDYGLRAWQTGFSLIRNALESSQMSHLSARYPTNKPRRIAVFLPIAYRGGSLREAKLMAEAIYLGSEQAGQKIEVILAYLENTFDSSEKFDDLLPAIKTRSYQWRKLEHDQAYCAMIYAGREQYLDADIYQVPDDGINQFIDCDFWIIVSDDLEYPLLPIRPYALMVYDYLPRYEPILSPLANQRFIAAALSADSVWVISDFIRQDILNYAGLQPAKVHKLPRLAPLFKRLTISSQQHTNQPYFIWTTSLAPHKNHEKAFKALQLYYHNYNGNFACYVTGVETQHLFKNKPHLLALVDNSIAGQSLNHKLKLMGELANQAYQNLLANAQFLWHAGQLDSGTFSVIEAAHYGIPALSSDYPIMREIDIQFNLNLSWMDAFSSVDMARALKRMEEEIDNLRCKVPSVEQLAKQSVEHLASDYWHVLREYL